MSIASTDKQFALIIEDFYDDETLEPMIVENRSDVFFLKIAAIIATIMLAVVACAYVAQHLTLIPVVVVLGIAVLTYRDMVKEHNEKAKA